MMIHVRAAVYGNPKPLCGQLDSPQDQIVDEVRWKELSRTLCSRCKKLYSKIVELEGRDEKVVPLSPQDLYRHPTKEVKKIDDPVNHPKHYTSDPSGVECITITRHRSFNIGNAFKYLWRAGLKFNPVLDEVARLDKEIEDLDKAVFYIQDERALLKEKRDKLEKILGSA